MSHLSAAARDRLHTALDAAGVERCADSSCMFGAPGGMATNGGCHCLERFEERLPAGVRAYVRRMAIAMRALAESAAAAAEGKS